MGNVFAILKRDLIRIAKVPAAWVIVTGLIFIPPLYAWFNIIGFWSPYTNTQGIQVVIANNDKGTENALVGKTNLGDQIVTQLKANHQLGWTFADESEALNRVQSGKAYAAIVIPSSFSDDMIGAITGGDRPQLEYYVNEKASAIAPKITDIGASTLDNQVNGTFVSTVSEALSDAVNKATDAAGGTADALRSSVLDDLDDARRDVANSRKVIASLKATLDETPAKTKEARASLDEVQSLLDKAGDGLGDASTLITGVQTRLNGFAGTASGALDTGSSLLSKTSQQAADGVNHVTAGLTVANGAAGDAITTLQNVNATNAAVIARLKAIAAELPAGDAGRAAIDKAIAKLETENRHTSETLADMKTLNTDTGNTIQSVSGLATGLSTATQSSLDATASARKAINSGSLPQLNQGLTTLAGAAGKLSGSLGAGAGTGGTSSAQNPLIAQTKAVLDQLESTAAATSTTLADTDKALKRMQTKLETTSTDLKALDTSSMLSDMLGADGKLDTKRIASFMLSPTVIDTKILYPVNAYGSGMAPLFTNMALWVGAFALAVIMKLETDDEGVEDMTITQGYMARFLLFGLFAAAQGAVTTLGDLIIGVQSVNPFAFVTTGVITSLVYASIVFAFSTTFLHVGKGICVALIILQIPGASGLYPIEMMPDFFRNLYPFFPFTYSIDAFRETIGGFYGTHWFSRIGRLLLFAVVAFALGLIVRPLMANVNRLFARQIDESDMIIGEPVHMPGTEYRVTAAVRVLANHEGYRERIERTAAAFAEQYPRLKRGALIAGLVVPAILIVTFSLTPNTKLEAMLAWLIWVLLIMAFLITIEYMRDSLRRQTELGNLDDDAIRSYIKGIEHSRERRRRRGRGKARKQATRNNPPKPSPEHTTPEHAQTRKETDR
ncbi:hypothetical protein COO72_06225 [Bifidobacterium callitrichos]|nr:hypothetical protein COO72_06225 [Bifidobacterium callitrichos]